MKKKVNPAMMDKIIIFVLFGTIGLASKGNAQLFCYVCTNCPDASALGTNLVRNCDLELQDPEGTTTTVDITTIQTTTTDVSGTTVTADGTATQTLPESPPPITTQLPSSPPFLKGHNYRNIMKELLGTHQCFIIERQVGDVVLVNRGCVATRENRNETCAAANLGVIPPNCYLCPSNQCNNASKYAVSLFIIFSSLFCTLTLSMK